MSLTFQMNKKLSRLGGLYVGRQADTAERAKTRDVISSTGKRKQRKTGKRQGFWLPKPTPRDLFPPSRLFCLKLTKQHHHHHLGTNCSIAETVQGFSCANHHVPSFYSRLQADFFFSKYFRGCLTIEALWKLRHIVEENWDWEEGLKKANICDVLPLVKGLSLVYFVFIESSQYLLELILVSSLSRALTGLWILLLNVPSSLLLNDRHHINHSQDNKPFSGNTSLMSWYLTYIWPCLIKVYRIYCKDEW